MADDADILVEVDGVHLAQLAAARNGFQDGHCHRNLDIALNRAGSALLDEHRECRNQHRVQFAGHTLGKTVVVGSHKRNLFVLDPLLKGNNITGHIPDLFDRAAALNIKGIQNILCLGTNRFFIGDVIGNGPHFFPVKLLGVKPHAVV